MLGTQDLLIGAIIVIVLFGAKRLPELARSVGTAMKEFRRGVAAEPDEDKARKSDLPAPVTSPVPRTCGSCKTPLEAAWSHCPHCGRAVDQGSATAPGA